MYQLVDMKTTDEKEVEIKEVDACKRISDTRLSVFNKQQQEMIQKLHQCYIVSLRELHYKYLNPIAEILSKPSDQVTGLEKFALARKNAFHLVENRQWFLNSKSRSNWLCCLLCPFMYYCDGETRGEYIRLHYLEYGSSYYKEAVRFYFYYKNYLPSDIPFAGKVIINAPQSIYRNFRVELHTSSSSIYLYHPDSISSH
jgi:hypothetical protein